MHLIGGIIGSVLVGVFADAGINGRDGLLFGEWEQLVRQVASVGIAVGYSFVVSYALLHVIKATIGIRVSEQEERQGLDLALHEEQSYVLSE